MSNEKVVSLAEHAENSRMWSTEQMLEELLADVKAGKVKPVKTIVLFWEEVSPGRLRRSARLVNFGYSDYAAYLAQAAHDALHDW